MAELSKKAREGKLGPVDMSGATFTISSLGGIGGRYFTPIINAPEVAILGVILFNTLLMALDNEAIDVLINNAGVIGGERQDFGAVDYEAWERTLRTNVLGPYRVSEALADLARITRNDTWLQLAAMFERPCFVGSLATGHASEAIESRGS